jgi:hypothetical protein
MENLEQILEIKQTKLCWVRFVLSLLYEILYLGNLLRFSTLQIVYLLKKIATAKNVFAV